MCNNKGNPSTTTSQSGTSTTSQSGTSSGSQAGTSSQVLGPTPETLDLYMQYLNRANDIWQNPFDTNTLPNTAPWTDAMNQAVNAQWALGQQGMGFVPEAAAALGQGAQSTVSQIPGVAASILSPWAGQAVNYGLDQGQAIGDWATSNANRIMSEGPQLTPFSKEAVEQYQSPYTQDVIDATQGWFNNQNAIQGNQLIGQGIRQGNVFGGDRAGVAQGVLAGQQQLAQAPVIAGLYNQGYAQALQEFNQQNALAAQLQQFGAGLGLQGLQAQGTLGMQGLGLGLNAATAANQQAIGALAQNQNAALQAGQMFGQLGATQFGSNLAGGGQAINAANVYPAWLQSVMNQQTQGGQQVAGYPFQTTSWYGGLLGGLGPLTGSQQAGSNTSVSQQQSNQIANQIAQQSGITTPPQPNQFVQAAGLGLAGLGLFLKDGGSVPHMAEGGGVGPYGGARVPYSKARGYVQDSGIRPGRLRAPDIPGDKPLTLQSLGRALTFMNLGSPSRAATAAASGSGGTLGQISSLLKTESAKGAAGGLSAFFGGGGGTNVTVGEDEITNAGFRRGGLVSRYADGGWDDDEEHNAGDDYPTPMPRPRPDEAGYGDLIPMPMSRPAEAALSDESPGFADRNMAPDLEGGSPAGPPEQAGDEEAAPGFGPRQGGLGQGRWLSRGTPRSQPGFLQRWAANPLTQIGLGLASQNSPTALGGIGQGLAKALPQIQRQHALDQQQETLDRKQTIDNSGMTQVVKFADGRIWDTGLPTPKALQQTRLAQTQKQQTSNKPVVIGETLGGRKIYGIPDPERPGRYRDPATGEPIDKAPTAFTPQQPVTNATIAESISEAPPQTEADKAATATAAAAAARSGIKTPHTPEQLELLKGFGWSPQTMDFNAIRLAGGDTSVTQGFGTGKAGAIMRGLLRDRAAQYYIDQGLTPKEANAAVAEFGAQKAGARSLGVLEARMTGALEKAKAVAPIVTDLSEKISRTDFPLVNNIIMAAKKGTGDPTVVQYGIALETLASNYGSSLGMGNSVLTDFQTRRAQDMLQKGYSSGQMKAAVDQILLEIDREQVGIRRSMDVYLGRKEPTAPPAAGPATAPPAAKTAPADHPPQVQNGVLYEWKDGGYKPVRRVQ